ncbi:DUF2922 domain-containing protein [Clostridium oceanicum]|uniref:DUF2922 domain-containing protein n=1 Tax=Clostridium oceanicum TaxID=1543 RepID=A0ABN1JKL3_9CLOT
MNRTLSMKFITEEGKKISFSISDVKEGLTKEDVSGLMDVIVEKKDAFAYDSPIVAKDSADIIERTTEEIYTA